MGVKYFQLCSVSVVNHKKQNKICQSQDSISSVNIKQTLCRILRNTATLNALRVDLHERYLILFKIFFSSLVPSWNFVILASNTSDPNRTKQTLYAFILFVKHDSLRLPHSLKKKKIIENNWPKMLLTRNYQITIISITFAFLSFTARSISSSFFSMSRRSNACVWK